MTGQMWNMREREHIRLHSLGTDNPSRSSLPRLCSELQPRGGMGWQPWEERRLSPWICDLDNCMTDGTAAEVRRSEGTG